MKTLFRKLSLKAQLWILNSCEVARFEGITIADLRNCNNRSPRFPEIMLAALQLLKATDPTRYARVRRRLAWISYETLAIRGSAEYHHATGRCCIDFLEQSPEYDKEFLVGSYASTLVHEATHGEIESRGIHYTPELRSRIEHLCVKQEQKFIKRLANTHPDLARSLHYEFDASNWEWSWKATRWERLQKEMKRIFFRNEQA